MQIAVSIPKNMVNEVDEFANIENRSRSELIREALRVYMQKAKYREKAINKELFIG